MRKIRINKLASILFTIGFFCVCSCQKRASTKEEILSYIKNPSNGLIKEVENNNIKAIVYYKSSDLFVLQELDRNSSLNSDSLKKMYDTNCFFVLNLSMSGQELEIYKIMDKNEMNERIAFLSNNLKDSFRIKGDNDVVVKLQDYQYTRMYGGTGNTVFLLVFDKEALNNLSSFDIELEIPELDIPLTKCHFRKRDIENIPLLDIYSKS